MSLLPTSMRDPGMQPLGPPLRLAAPPQPDRRAENMARWFENGQFEIDAKTGKPTDANAPGRMAGLHDDLDAMMAQATKGILYTALNCDAHRELREALYREFEYAPSPAQAWAWVQASECWGRMLAGEG